MSTSASHQSDLQEFAAPQFPCEHPDCDDTFSEPTAVKGSYCSRDCWLRSKGANVLSELRRDHTICATCFRVIKEVEQPPEGVSVKVPVPEPPHDIDDRDGIKDVLIGYQYATPSTEFAIDDMSTDPYRVQERRRWSCTCGTVDPSERDDILENIDLEETIVRLLKRLRERYDEGNLPNRPSKQRLFDALREEWRDWEYAIGCAVWG